jgi:hypothetical protein
MIRTGSPPEATASGNAVFRRIGEKIFLAGEGSNEWSALPAESGRESSHARLNSLPRAHREQRSAPFCSASLSSDNDHP